MKAKIVMGSVLAVVLMAVLPAVQAVEYDTARETQQAWAEEQVASLDVRELLARLQSGEKGEDFEQLMAENGLANCILAPPQVAGPHPAQRADDSPQAGRQNHGPTGGDAHQTAVPALPAHAFAPPADAAAPAGGHDPPDRAAQGGNLPLQDAGPDAVPALPLQAHPGVVVDIKSPSFPAYQSTQ